jgi:hypothetical protein
MTKKSDVLAAYAAGKKAVEGKARYAAFLGAALGPVIGRIVWRRYSLGSFEGISISVLAVVLLVLLFSLVEERVRRATDERRQDHT